MTSHATWYSARAAGLVTWGLLVASVLSGLLMTAARIRRPARGWQLDLHRFLGAAALVFCSIHVTSILADRHVDFDLAAVLIPFAAKWHPAAVAGGILALYLLVTVELTSLARHSLPARWWRAIHLSSIGAFVLATAHALAAGTDTRAAIATWVAATALAALGVLVVARLPGEREPSRT